MWSRTSCYVGSHLFAGECQRENQQKQPSSFRAGPTFLPEGGRHPRGRKKRWIRFMCFPYVFNGFHLFLILGFGIRFIHLFSYGGRCFSAVWGVLRAELLFLLSPCGSRSSILGHALPSADGAGMRQLLESGAGKLGEGGKCAYPAFFNLVHSLGKCQDQATRFANIIFNTRSQTMYEFYWK